MTDCKHTHGPWNTMAANPALVIGGNPSFLIANCQNGRSVVGNVEDEANARLIAAAPDMHGALVEAAQVAFEAFQAALQDVPDGSCIPPWIARLEQAAERAHAALVKADARFKARSA